MKLLVPLASLLACLSLTQDRPAAGSPRIRLLVPAYFYPAGKALKDWDRLFAAAEQVPLTAIVNPASGPGKKADPNYLKILAHAKKSRIVLIGYITTSYAKRPLQDVKNDVDTWLRLYPGIGGIFFDEQKSGEDSVAYQAELYKYVRSKRGLKLVVSNPGTVCSEKYLSRPASDVVCLFEGPKAFPGSDFPVWEGRYGAERICTLSYNISTKEEMRKIVQSAVTKKIGHLFVTDAGGSNPWNRLPSYWDELVKEVRQRNSPERK